MDRQVQHQIHLLAEAFANDAAFAFLQGFCVLLFMK
jgi:hypothetical protein